MEGLFLIVSIITVIPVLATVGIINVSSRPSLAFRTFPQAPVGDPAVTLDWPALAKIRDGTMMRAKVVRVPGYMIPFDDPTDANNG